MNERIKELRRQVFAETDEILAAGARDNNVKILLDIMSVPGNKQLVDLFFEKFAELIVKECTNIVLHYADVDEGVAVAKKHFGVEE